MDTFRLVPVPTELGFRLERQYFIREGQYKSDKPHWHGLGISNIFKTPEEAQEYIKRVVEFHKTVTTVEFEAEWIR